MVEMIYFHAVLSILYMTGNIVNASLPPVSTSDRIVFKSNNFSDDMKEQIKYSFFLLETDGSIEDHCAFLIERFQNIYVDHKWICVHGADTVSKDSDEDPFGLFEYLPPGLGFSIKGVYISYDGSLKSASSFLLISKPNKQNDKGEKIEEAKLYTFFCNTSYFLSVFLSIVASFVIWRHPVTDSYSSPPSNTRQS